MSTLKQVSSKTVEHLDNSHGQRLHNHYFAQFTGLAQSLVMLIAISALLGWWLDIDLLKRGISGLASIKPLTAVSFFLLGFAAWLQLLKPTSQWVYRTVAAIAAFIGILSVAEYVFNIDFNMDQLLFHNQVNMEVNAFPGRMSLITSLYIAGAGISIILQSIQSGKYISLGQTLALFGVLIGFSSLLGYTYGIEQLYHVFAFSTVSIQSTILFILFGLSLLLSQPSEGFVEVISTHHYGGLIARKILPLAIASPFIIGWLRHSGRQAGLYEVEFGEAIGTTANILVFVTLVWFSARQLNKIDKSQRKAEQELRIAAVAFESEEAIAIIDTKKIILRTNQSFTKITGYAEQEAVGRTYPIIHANDNQAIDTFDTIWRALERKHHWYGEVLAYRKNGDRYPAWLNITAVTNLEGAVTHYVVTFSDITVRKAAEDEIELLAFYDPLTGMPNRRLLRDRLQQSFSAATLHSASHTALLFIDLDNFKMLNDSKGHSVGDLLLKEAAKRLQACIRKADTASRVGGDEFVVLLADLGEKQQKAEQEVEKISEKILNLLSQPCILDDYEYQGSASIGIYLFSHQEEISAEEVLKYADSAMYQAKSAGRNTVRFYDPRMQQTLEARVALESDLRLAIIDNQFELYYQAQVNHTNQVIGAEALIRWHHPLKGMVPPNEFIPIAEETGLILLIGDWVLETACAQLKQWEANPTTSSLQLAVNVSAHQFAHPGFVGQVQRMLEKYALTPSLLKLELTETAVLDNIEEATLKMITLKAAGVLFSIDDFGTGYSSLSYLTKLPIDQIKIDQSFVANIGSKHSDAIVQTIIGMAGNLDMEVIAEGVENSNQRQFLEKSNCLLYQGYLFSKPQPIEIFTASLKNYI